VLVWDDMRTWVREHDRLLRRTIVGALLALFLAGVGIGGYLSGSSDIDVEAVALTAAAEGQEAGSKRGMTEGYAAGFRSARKRTYASTYSAAYRDAYAGEFESASLDPPERIRVPDQR
jgi:hypothetical protein